jgi:hypothetical protein
MIVLEASYTSSSHSAQAAYTNEYKICENCQLSSREICILGNYICVCYSGV